LPMTPNLRGKSSVLRILILSLLGLQACVIIPTPWVRDRFSNDQVSTVTAGLSSRYEVLGKFGEPDVIWETEQKEDVFIYKWERVRAFWLLAGAGGGMTGGPFSTDEALIILFDEASCVKRVDKVTKSLSESYGDFLTRWLGQNGQ
jgi:hypothetical protein